MDEANAGARPGNRRRFVTSKFASKASAPNASAATIEQRWHWKGTANQGIWDVDFHPLLPRLLTAGDDGRAMIWDITAPTPAADGSMQELEVEYVSCLVTAAVQSGCNAAKWAPSGELIATGYDGGTVYLWRKTKNVSGGMHDDTDYNKEQWTLFRSLKQSRASDVSALCWAPTHEYLIAVTARGQTVVWDVRTGATLNVFDDHQYRACGIALDPFGSELVTVGDDQKVCFYRFANTTDGFQTQRVLSTDVAKGLVDQDKFRSILRRADWSPDGMWLLVPTGFQKVQRPKDNLKRKLDEGVEAKDPLSQFTEVHGSHVYLRGKYDKPVAFLAAPAGMTPYCVAWSPRLYAQAAVDTGMASIWGDLPYRMAYCVAARSRGSKANKILLYDTAHEAPLLEFNNLHFMPVTNACWCPSGNRLFASSRDGYISFIEIEPGVLGDDIPDDYREALMMQDAVRQLKARLREKANGVLDTLKEQLRAQQAKRKEQLAAQKKRKLDKAAASATTTANAPSTGTAASGAAAAGTATAAASDAAPASAASAEKPAVPLPAPGVHVPKVKKRITPVIVST